MCSKDFQSHKTPPCSWTQILWKLLRQAYLDKVQRFTLETLGFSGIYYLFTLFIINKGAFSRAHISNILMIVLQIFIQFGAGIKLLSKQIQAQKQSRVCVIISPHPYVNVHLNNPLRRHNITVVSQPVYCGWSDDHGHSWIMISTYSTTSFLKHIVVFNPLLLPCSFKTRLMHNN